MKLLFFLLLLVTSVLSKAEESGALNALQKQFSESVQSQAGGAADLMALDLLASKLKISPGNTTDSPEWFTEYYPIPAEMDPDQPHLPRLKFQYSVPSSVSIFAPIWEAYRSKSDASDTTCNTQLNPPTPLFSAPNDNPFCRLDAREFLIDRSGLASLEKNPMIGQYQGGYISIPKLDGLSESQQQALMTQTNFSLPMSTSSVSPIKVKIRKLVPHEDFPLALGKIEVQVGSTIALIPVALPPEPNCQIRIAPGQIEPFQPGSTVKFELSVNSVTISAKKIDGDLEIGEEFDVDLTEAPRFLTSSLGITQKLVDFELTIPDDFSGSPLPERPSEMGWMVSAKVSGVLGNGYQSCKLSKPARVGRPPAPECNLVASNQNISQGNTTQLTLSKQSPDTLVSEAYIGGSNVSAQMLANGSVQQAYRKTTGLSETVTARLVGPGGERTCSVVLNPSCPWERTDYYEKLTNLGFTFGRTYKVVDNDKRYTSQCEADRAVRLTTNWRSRAGGRSWLNCGTGQLCILNYLRTNSDVYTGISITNLGGSSCRIDGTFSRNGGCFSPDTKIQMANGSVKLASQIQENDQVYNPHYGAGIRVRKVVKGPETKSLYEVRMGSRKVKVTEDHPFLTGRGWVQAMALKKGDNLLGNGKPTVVSDVMRLQYKGPQDVWNFELDTEDPMAHVVIANGIPTGDLVTQLKLKKLNSKVP